MAKEKRVELKSKIGDTTYHDGYAHLTKNSKGEVEIDLTITSLPLIEELGGSRIKGVLENYEKDDLD